MKIQEYRHTDGLRRWELLFEGFYLVLLIEDAPKPYCNQLLAFEGFGSLVWSVSPSTEQVLDHIANVWVEGGLLCAGSYSGYKLQIDYKTGRVLSTVCTK